MGHLTRTVGHPPIRERVGKDNPDLTLHHSLGVLLVPPISHTEPAARIQEVPMKGPLGLHLNISFKPTALPFSSVLSSMISPIWMAAVCENLYINDYKRFPSKEKYSANN